MDAFLYGDSAGSPDNANQTFLGSGFPTAAFGASNNSLVSFAVTGNVAVTIGSTYWLVLKPVGFGLDAWNFSSGTPGLVAESTTVYQTWIPSGTVLPAFRITAIPAVPDSGDTALLLVGSVVVLVVLKRIVPD